MSTLQVNQYPAEVEAVLNVLHEHQVPYELRVFEKPAHQASQAAALLNCPLGAIVKSLVFEILSSDDILLVLVSGQNRADLKALKTLLGVAVEPAKPNVVLEKTGYPVGAVPPLGLPGLVQTVIDADLLNFQQVWASAGAENILFQINPFDLIILGNGQVKEIKRS